MAQICTKSFVGCGLAPDPLTALRGPTSKGREREGGGEGRGREGRGKGGRKGTGGKGRGREKGSRREGIAVEKNPYFKACTMHTRRAVKTAQNLSVGISRSNCFSSDKAATLTHKLMYHGSSVVSWKPLCH